jgi:hypothetical protein
MSLKKTWLLVVVLISSMVYGQQLSFNGRVLNDKNEPVAGASVKIISTGKATSTSVDGRFAFSLEAGKKYEIEITAVSYQTKRISDISVGQGLDNYLDIALETSVKTMEGVVVKSTPRRQENTMALLNFQRNNTAMSSGLAADFIRSTPDKNTGEVLKRVSGASIQDNKYVVVRGLSDRYNQALLNDAPMPSSEPDKKAFSFDMIPSVMIDNIIINKTATPDLPGEFAGGLVQVNTKDVPTKNQLQVGFSLGYNTQSTFRDFTSNSRNSLDWLGFDDGTRSLPSALPNVADYRALSDAGKIEATRNLFRGDVYGEVINTAAPITTFNLAWSNKTSFKNGGSFGTIISVNHRRSQIVYDEVIRGRYESVRTPIFEGNEVQNRFSVNAGVLANFTYIKGNHKLSFKNLFNQLYDDNYYSRLLENTGRLQNVSLRSSFLNQRSLYSGQLEGEHSLTKSGIKLKWNGNISHNYKTQPDFRTAQYVQSFSSPNSPFELDDDDTRRFFSTLRDYNAGANGSLLIPFKMAGDKQSFKIGGGTLVRFRDFDARVFRYEPASSSSNLAAPFDKAFLPSNVNQNGFFLDEQTQNTDTYFGISALNSAYAMFDNRIGDLRVIWGLRAEFFEQFLRSRDLSLKQVIVNTEKWDFLPSLNITYALTPKNQLRVAASKTVARPEFREIAPFQFFDYEQIWGIAGDTELKRTSILNADLRYEYYPKAGEVLSVGLLAKKFTNPIEIRMDPGSNGDRWLFNYTNADEATLVGAEVEIRKSLDFISEKLNKLVFIGNATVLSSTVTLTTERSGAVKESVDRPLYGQSPYLVNAGFQYTTAAWNMTALYNRIGPRLSLVGDPTGAGFFDIYEKSRNLVDLQVARKLWEGKGELKLTVSDLLNNQFAFYDNPTKKAGYEFSAGDRLNYAYRPGTTITIGFNYNFDLNKNK